MENELARYSQSLPQKSTQIWNGRSGPTDSRTRKNICKILKKKIISTIFTYTSMDCELVRTSLTVQCNRDPLFFKMPFMPQCTRVSKKKSNHILDFFIGGSDFPLLWVHHKASGWWDREHSYFSAPIHRPRACARNRDLGNRARTFRQPVRETRYKLLLLQSSCEALWRWRMVAGSASNEGRLVGRMKCSSKAGSTGGGFWATGSFSWFNSNMP